MALIDGTPDADDLTGGPSDDTIRGFGGDDSLDGGGGADTLFGGDGQDVLFGGPGPDTLNGGLGNDFLSGGGGGDILNGGGGDDELFGSGGSDIMNGGSGDDRLVLDSAKDLSPFEQLNGGAGIDSLSFLSGPIDISAVAITGIETLIAFGTVKMTAEQLGSFSAVGAVKGIELTTGGTVDLAGVQLHAPNIRLNDAGKHLILSGALGGGTRVLGGAGDDFVTAATAAPPDGPIAIYYLHGGGGADELIGGWGNDIIHGDDGNDWLSGFKGDDILIGGAGDDTLFGGSGTDILKGGAGDDTIIVDPAGNLTPLEHLDGGDGEDNLSLLNGMVDLSAVDMTSIETVSASDSVKMTAEQLGGFSGVTTYKAIIVTTAGEIDLTDTRIWASRIELNDAGNTVIMPTAASPVGRYAIVGGLGNDIVTAGGGDVSFFGGGGDDILLGGVGNDVLNGGAGNDMLSGSGGEDVFIGGSGDDVISVNPATDWSAGDQVHGGVGNDEIEVFHGAIDISANVITGVEMIHSTDAISMTAEQLGQFNYVTTAAAVHLTTGGRVDLTGKNLYPELDLSDAGNTIILPDEITFMVKGGAGDDLVRATGDGAWIQGGDGADKLMGSRGDDLLEGDAGNDRLFGGGGADTIRGGDGQDALAGGGGDDTLDGGDGNDLLFGGAGADIMNGGAGDDVLILDPASDLVAGEQIHGGEGFDDLSLLNGRFDISNAEIDGVERLSVIASVFLTVDQFNAFSSINLSGQLGFTTAGEIDLRNLNLHSLRGVYLSDLGNTLTLQWDAQYPVFGGAGDDVVNGGIGGDHIYGGGGKDELHGGLGDDRLQGGDGDDHLYGEYDNDRLLGEAGDDWLIDTTGADVLNGGDGNDEISGSVMSKILNGGAGDDHILVSSDSTTAGAVRIIGGAGIDSLTPAGGGIFDFTGWTISGVEQLVTTETVLLTVDQLNAFSSVEIYNSLYLTTSGSVDLSRGNYVRMEDIHLSDAGNRLILPYAPANGSIEVIGGAGDDRITVAHDPTGTGPNDQIGFVLSGGGGADVVNGSRGEDQIDGGEGDDVLRGGESHDRITGGAGADVLTGGGGGDTFIFHSISDSGLGAAGDAITDFREAAGDLIDLQDVAPSLAYIGVADFDGAGAGQVRIAVSPGDHVVQVDADGDGAADMEIHLGAAVIHSAAAFIL